LHPLAVILAILCGAELGGLAGIFLAIPAVAVISVAYRHFRDHRAAEVQNGLP
jgi:predicted PurR-regulated permease PerM